MKSLFAVVILPTVWFAEPSDAAKFENGPGPGPGPYVCAGVQGSQAAIATPIDLSTCTAGLNQEFVLLGDHTFSNGVLGIEILTMGGAFCVDVVSAGVFPGTLVQIYTCNDTGAQVWNYTVFGQLINVNSGLCLDSQGSGQQLVLNQCISTRGTQIWRIDSD